FIQDISKTGPIRELHKYLIGEGLALTSMENFQKKLFEIWFHGYRRKSNNDSSGFEHVFVGEIWRSKVTGLHNWLQLYHLEKEKQVDYRGHFKFYPSEPIRLKLQFHWGKYKKKISSVFFGTSPEFEVA
ncbi:hypothetical protein, partial [Salmonella sp. s54412]|uniref:hypothetical protein n=1 Tax=Salmonella sp. s54412 TaxID=3160128 RepID=UPI00375422E0